MGNFIMFIWRAIASFQFSIVCVSGLLKRTKILHSKAGVVLLMAVAILMPSNVLAQMSICSSVGSVNLISAKRIDQYNGVVTFSVKDGDGKNIDMDIAPNEISLTINGFEVCNKEITRESKELLDLIIAVDVSKSMDDAINALHMGLPSLIEAIANKYETNAVVTTFGYGSYDECNFRFYEPSLIPIDPKDPWNSFINPYYTEERITTNQTAYNYEGYYSMLMQIADYPYRNYRPQAKKAIIMLGNESAYASANRSGEEERTNDMDCKNGGVVINQSEVTSKLHEMGFQVFIINGNEGFSEIASGTGGGEFPVYPAEYTESVLPAISAGMTTTYTMHFEFCESKPSCDNTVSSILSICGESSSLNSKLDYEPSIMRTVETSSLDENGVMKNQAVTLGFTVDYSECKELDHAEIVYTYIDGNGERTEETGICELSNGTYTVTIPAENVNPDKIEYTIYAYFTDGTTVTCSPISTGLTGYTWTIPVHEAHAPVVTNVQWGGDYLYSCGEKQVCAEITDEDGTISEAYIMYSNYISGQDKYTFANSEPMTTEDGVTYCATLPADAGGTRGLAYYIYAKDNDGLKGYHGRENGNEGYNTLLYEQDMSDQKVTVVLVKSDECENQFEEGDYAVAYYEGCNGYLAIASDHAPLSDDDYNEILVSINTSDIHQNGVRDNQSAYIALYRETSDGRFVSSRYVKIDNLRNNMIVDICPEGSVDDMLNVIYDDGIMLNNGGFAICASPGPMRFNVVNNSEYKNDWIINSIKIVPDTYFKLEDFIKDTVVRYGENMSFTVRFTGDEDAEADMYIYNNTMTDPMVIHLVADLPEKCGDKIVIKDPNNIAVRVDGNQEFVTFKATAEDGRVVSTYNNYLGGGLQNIPTPFNGINKLHVELTKSGETCVKDIILNPSQQEQEQEEPQNGCAGIINHLITQYVTLANVHVEKPSVVYMEVLSLSGTPTGLYYGPSMQHAADQDLRLGNQLPPNTYVLKVMIDNQVCSSTFVVK